MRKVLLATTMVLAASIGVAMAQNAAGTSPQPTEPSEQTAQPSDQTAQPSERGGMMSGMMGGRMMSGGMRGRRMGEHERPMMMMAQTTAAIFRIRRGDTSIFIKCAENESMQACITAAGTLLDKLNPQH